MYREPAWQKYRVVLLIFCLPEAPVINILSLEAGLSIKTANWLGWTNQPGFLGHQASCCATDGFQAASPASSAWMIHGKRIESYLRHSTSDQSPGRVEGPACRGCWRPLLVDLWRSLEPCRGCPSKPRAPCRSAGGFQTHIHGADPKHTPLGQGKVQVSRLGKGLYQSWPHHSNKVWFNAVVATFTPNGRAPNQDMAMNLENPKAALTLAWLVTITPHIFSEQSLRRRSEQ